MVRITHPEKPEPIAAISRSEIEEYCRDIASHIPGHGIDWHAAFVDLVRCVGTALYGKECWFEQENGTWYSRNSCSYIDVDGVIDEMTRMASE